MPDLVRFGVRHPGVGRRILRLSSRFLHQPGAGLCRLASELDYYPIVQTILGNGMDIRVFWGQAVANGILAKGFNDVGTARVVAQLLKPGMTFFDVGAGVGQYTLLASGILGPPGRVHTFESSRRVFAVLEANMFRNEVSNVFVNRAEVGAQSGSSQPVPRVSLDDYIREHRIERIDLMRIAVDGGELDVLRGAGRLLSSSNPPQIIADFAETDAAVRDHARNEMATFFGGLGLELSMIGPKGLVPYSEAAVAPTSFALLAVPPVHALRQYRAI